MRRIVLVSALLCIVLGVTHPTHADATDYQITAAEKAACYGDAVRFCSSTYPDQNALLACMHQNVELLSATCATTFKAGLRRRHLI